MNKDILNTDVQEFINNNLKSDIISVLLKKSIFPNVSSKELVEQIEAKNRCATKLETWFNTPNIYYPNKLNIEQTSSEKTAAYKASILNKKTVLDLSGGFGVDSYYFSKKTSLVYHCEINKRLSAIVSHNYKNLNVKNIQTIAQDGLLFLKDAEKLLDWIYIDPSRRNDLKGKVFKLSDCLPNVPKHIKFLWEHANNILIKTSPLLDFSIGLSELKNVKEIHVVALQNEVKELLWVLEKDYTGSTQIHTVNITKQKTDSFSYVLNSENDVITKYSLPLSYLYEPNAAILKSGAFKSIGHQYNLLKLQTNSHLYTSPNLIDFPGRIFKIEDQLPYNKRALKKLNIKKANITTRNFPEDVATIRKKFKIVDGGAIYLFFTKDQDNNTIVLICSKASK